MFHSKLPGYAASFGDSSPLSAAANPTHTYTDPRTFNVSPTVTAGLHEHTVVKTGYITVDPFIDLIFADGFESGLGAWSQVVDTDVDLVV